MSEDTGTKYDFDASFQKKVVSLLLHDTTFALKAANVVHPSYFGEDAQGIVVDMVRDYVQLHKARPDPSLLPTLLKDEIAKKRIRDDLKEPVKDIIREALTKKPDLSGSKFVLDKIADFARHQAIEQALIGSVKLLEKGDFDGIAKLQREALKVGTFVDGDDYDYWSGIESRTKLREDFKAGLIVKTGISTGVPEIDANLHHHGWGRKELSLIMGAAKAGKSWSLGEFTKNASLLGYNTAYMSCEVSKEIISDRIDAALADTAVRLLKDDPATVRSRIKAAEARAGAFKLRDFASGTLKPSQIYRMVETYRQDGIMIDLLTVDYADIMAAEYRSDNHIDNMRSIYVDLRAIAFEFDIAVLTATQTNREGAKRATSLATDVAEDFNKIRTADIILAINATPEEKKDGMMRITWAASRNTEDGFALLVKQDREKMKFITKVIGRV